MSLFIVAQRLGGKPRLFHTRQLPVSFGEDYYGVIAWANLRSRFFSISALDTGYTLTAHRELCGEGEIRYASGEQCSLKGVCVMTADDYTFRILGTPGTGNAG